jgi:hypothetical protein
MGDHHPDEIDVGIAGQFDRHVLHHAIVCGDQRLARWRVRGDGVCGMFVRRGRGNREGDGQGNRGEPTRVH